MRSRVHNADLALIEDACAFAWAALVRRQDVDPESPTVFGWLCAIAIRKGWEMAREQTASGEVIPEQAAAVVGVVEAKVEADEALALIERLPERQQQVMILQVLGLSREEIAETLGLIRYGDAIAAVASGRRVHFTGPAQDLADDHPVPRASGCRSSRWRSSAGISPSTSCDDRAPVACGPD